MAQLRVVLLVAVLQLVMSELHQSLLAVCTAWDGVTCPFTTAAPLASLWDRRSQTLCKASVAVSVKQIDWQSNLITGKGLVRSVKVNGNELLTSLVYPSDAYVAPNYPHCDDWYDRSILPFITNASVAFQIEFEWTGDHSQRHDCSFGGISYVGLAQMDLYYEIQDDSACPGWHPNTHSWCSGHGQCDCATSEHANRTCLCQYVLANTRYARTRYE
ncbi:hypothetical protein SPRG_12608 [Saprolegnia parasitica CBS 223.65]|uniref:EGF-like domain-containing protein n=1 Tax=Saprolegnia parasitica (strain CBS 223.65) TaxID=695850 RepID=A0A067BY69_SAPPC|nr:hypothetical protein SPRG_12608 [Saprolegnia parasitica CBS 223.65]KDO21790.1 hypothetical protein SPRG_12608 [Saprolegnia parasitica CBS 223.65]|eukprot:XP_012207469.1 hypothetical protein SPRG_12608 [Saprolegnia parasitica CBS 223.65]